MVGYKPMYGNTDSMTSLLCGKDIPIICVNNRQLGSVRFIWEPEIDEAKFPVSILGKLSHIPKICEKMNQVSDIL